MRTSSSRRANPSIAFHSVILHRSTLSGSQHLSARHALLLAAIRVRFHIIHSLENMHDQYLHTLYVRALRIIWKRARRGVFFTVLGRGCVLPFLLFRLSSVASAAAITAGTVLLLLLVLNRYHFKPPTPVGTSNALSQDGSSVDTSPAHLRDGPSPRLLTSRHASLTTW